MQKISFVSVGITQLGRWYRWESFLVLKSWQIFQGTSNFPTLDIISMFAASIPEAFRQFKTNIWFPFHSMSNCFAFYRFLLSHWTLNSSSSLSSSSTRSLKLNREIFRFSRRWSICWKGINSNTAQNLNLTKDKQS